MADNPVTSGADRSNERSRELAKRAARVIPDAAQTGSKRPSQFVQGISPTHIERADGSHLWDVDGNKYIDCNAALGPILLGHDYPPVTRAVTSQLDQGTMFTMEHPLQVEVAEQLTEIVPCAEMVRFAKNGNDVTSLAAKVARAHTGRNVIATQGYHGWPDVWMADEADLNAGIPEPVAKYTESFEYNDIDSLERIFDNHPDDVAAIVTTPVNLASPEDGFLERMREIATREGALLVFDEVLTGFRFALGGAQAYYGVTPDLACFGKGMANGYPISALAGREDVMQTLSRDDVFYSMTYAGEAASLAAAKATLDVLRTEDVHDRVFEVGETLMNGYNELAEEFGLSNLTQAKGLPPRFSLTFTDDDGEIDYLARSLFMQEAHKRGVLVAGSHLPMYSHTEADVETMLETYRQCLDHLSEAIEANEVESRLDGDRVGATLRQRTGERDDADR